MSRYNKNWLKEARLTEEEWTKIRRKILIRDKHQCQICGYQDNLLPFLFICKYHKVLNIHHLDKNKSNNSSNNLIVVCTPCHMGLDKNRLNKAMKVIENLK